MNALDLARAKLAAQHHVPTKLPPPPQADEADLDPALDPPAVQAAIALQSLAMLAANTGEADEEMEPPAPPPTAEGTSRPDPDYVPPVKLSDVGNGHRFAREHGPDLWYVDMWKEWLVWDDMRWYRDHVREVEARAKQTVGKMFLEAAEELQQVGGALQKPAAGGEEGESKPNPAARHAEAKLAWARKSHSAKGLANMLAMARSERAVAALPDLFDTDPWALVTPTGTVDLRTGQVRPHRRADYLTKLCATAYDPHATCPTWEQFLDAVFCHDEELIAYIRRLVGYALTGATTEHILPVFWGGGGNGKSTFLELVMEVMGDDYAMKAPPAMLMARDREAHPTERADLHGKRLVCAVETEDGHRLAETLVKELTGGDKVRARRMRQDFFEFDPTHKLILCTNHKPQVRGTDAGIWRRVRLVPFNARFWDADQPAVPNEVRDPALKADKTINARLQAEAPGILAWMVRGCLEWQAHGLGCPSQVAAATAAYRSEEDTVGAFVTEKCIVSGSVREKAGNIYAGFKAWYQCNGQDDIPSQRAFGLAMTAAGRERRKLNGTDWYIGIGLMPDAGGEDVPD